MLFLLLARARERLGGSKLTTTAREKLIQAESSTYARMNAAFQLGTHASRKNHSQHVVQVFENKIDNLSALSATDQSRPH
jgi:hypothetical protein